MAEEIDIQRVSERELQRIFNEADYWGKVQRLEFYSEIRRCRPKPLDSGPQEPIGTVSQSIEYFDRDGRRMARVHWYLRPDGSIAASGRPDPKYVYLDGTVYRRLRKTDPGYVS